LVTTSIERVDKKVLCIPAIELMPKRTRAYAVLVHGYGGCKEELLGLAWRIALIGVHAVTIDLRGHGENELLFDEKIINDVQAAVSCYKTLGKVIAIGHSLGGRLCLQSNADYSIGISPALPQTYSEATQQFIAQMRAHRVREARPGVNFEILRSLPTWNQPNSPIAAIVYASRDVPEIKIECERLKKEGGWINQMENTNHADIYLSKQTFETVEERIESWLSP